MNRVFVQVLIRTTVVSMLAGGGATLWAQPNRPAGAPKKSAVKPAPKPRAGRVPPAARRPYRVPPQDRNAIRAWHDRRGWFVPGAWAAHEAWQAHKAREWRLEHRAWDLRGGYHGHFIPEPVFLSTFGPGHWFRIATRPMIVAGYPRFRHGGYWFMFVDPWPEFWADDWYDTDDVYVDFDDGYYLFSRRSPDVRIALNVIID